MYKLKDVAEIQTGIYVKASPSPDTVYLQVNDFEVNGVIYDTAKPSIITTAKDKEHYLNASDLLFAAKGTNKICAIFTRNDEKCVASSSFLVVRIAKNKIAEPEYINSYLNLPSTIMLLSSNAVGTFIPSITKAMPYVATRAEIAENDYNLNIPRYVDTYEEEEEIDIVAVQKEINTLEAELTEVQAKMKGYLKELGYQE